MQYKVICSDCGKDKVGDSQFFLPPKGWTRLNFALSGVGGAGES